MARPRKRFRKINIEISNVCNLRCSFCPPVHRPFGYMDPRLFRTIIEQVATLTEQVCFHLMGEPLLHPRLPEFVSICQEYQVRIYFVTNGIALNEPNTELLLHPAFQQINFSLHSFNDNFGDKDPGPYLKRIFDFTDRAFDSRKDLFINYRLWNLSSPRGTGPGNQDLIQRIEKHFNLTLPAEQNILLKKSAHLKNRLFAHFDTEFVWPGMELPAITQKGTCYGLSSHFGILVDGTVVPCCLDKEGAIALGHVLERPITETLMNARAQALVTGFQDNRLVEPLCQRCRYIERF